MKRAVKLSLKFCTARKRRLLHALVVEQRAAVNTYLPHCHEGAKLDKVTKALYTGGRVTSRQASAALNQAVSITTANQTRHRGRAVRPTLKGAVTFSNTCQVQPGRCSFDYVIKLACLKRGEPVHIPVRGTAVLTKWLSMPGASLVQGCALSENNVVVWVDVPDSPLRESGTAGAVDIGMCKLLTYTDGQDHTFEGAEFKRLSEKLQRKRPGSNACRRARIERDEYIDATVKSLPWEKLNLLIIEDLKGLKTGKSPKRSKQFRKKQTPWRYCHIIKRIEQTAEANRVRLVRVDPAFTSQYCQACGTVSALNRAGELFRCVSCGHTGDADLIGARNILALGLSEPTHRSLRSQCSSKVERPKAKTSNF